MDLHLPKLLAEFEVAAKVDFIPPIVFSSHFFRCECGESWKMGLEVGGDICPVCGKKAIGIGAPTPKYLMKFQQWLESNFVQIPEDALYALQRLVARKNNVQFLLSLQRRGFPKYQLGNISINNNPVNVFLQRLPHAQYIHSPDASQNAEILLPYHGNARETMDDILHELGHASDPKMLSDRLRLSDRYQKVEKKLQQGEPRTEEEEKSYLKEPVEFDAIGADFVVRVWRRFNDMAEPDQKQTFIQDIEQWLRTGGNPPDACYLPQNLLAAWQSKPTLWRKFQQRLFNLAQQLRQSIGS